MKGNKHWQTNGREKHRKYYRYIGSNILHSIDSSGILLGTWSPQQNLVFFSGHFGLRCTVYKIYKHEYIHTPIFHPKKTQDTSLHQDLFVNVSGLSILVCFRGRKLSEFQLRKRLLTKAFAHRLAFLKGMRDIDTVAMSKHSPGNYGDFKGLLWGFMLEHLKILCTSFFLKFIID